MTADYSQIEMRIMAHLSEDAALIEAFQSGEDLHAFTASRVFGVAAADVTLEQRSKIKAMSYGLAYGLSAFGLSRQLGISAEEARGLMDEYFARFGGVRDYLRDIVAEARRSGFTETILGRRRYLPDLVSDNRQRREMAERMALNAPIQGSAADIIKVAMLNVDRALDRRGAGLAGAAAGARRAGLEVAPGEREALETLVRREMGAAYQLSVPLDVSVGLRPHLAGRRPLPAATPRSAQTVVATLRRHVGNSSGTLRGAPNPFPAPRVDIRSTSADRVDIGRSARNVRGRGPPHAHQPGAGRAHRRGVRQPGRRCRRRAADPRRAQHGRRVRDRRSHRRRRSGRSLAAVGPGRARQLRAGRPAVRPGRRWRRRQSPWVAAR